MRVGVLAGRPLEYGEQPLPPFASSAFMTPTDDDLPTADIETLRFRAAVLRRVRDTFDSRGYWEVQTPLLSRDICVDAWIDPFELPRIGPKGESFYLQTSPEFAMKRLLAAGADAIYEVTRSFRRGEYGERHNPEFTMVEWYRIGDDHHAQMAFTEQLVRAAAELRPDRARRLPDNPFPKLAYDDAFEQATGERVLEAETPQLIALARRLEISAPKSLAPDDRDGWLNLILAERVEPYLQTLGTVYLYDFPASQSALAKVRGEGATAVAERFELYLDGIEMCNGYHELTDADELRRRMQRQSTLRTQSGRETLPTESRLLSAMARGLPPCSGVALGFDRLLMWLVGTERLASVTAFPFGRA